MKIYLNELSDQEKILEFTEKEEWIAQAIARADEQDVPGDVRPQGTAEHPRPISVRLSLRKVDDVVVLAGDIEAYIELVCSRCATRFKRDCAPHFEALFCKDPVMAGVGYLQKGSDGESTPQARNQGHARHAHSEESDERESQGKDFDITYLSNDYIDLDSVVTEQIQFQIPFQPLCQEDCQGMCTQCGTDLNDGKCKCAPINLAFSMLRDFKIQQK